MVYYLGHTQGNIIYLMYFSPHGLLEKFPTGVCHISLPYSPTSLLFRPAFRYLIASFHPYFQPTNRLFNIFYATSHHKQQIALHNSFLYISLILHGLSGLPLPTHKSSCLSYYSSSSSFAQSYYFIFVNLSSYVKLFVPIIFIIVVIYFPVIFTS